MSEGFTVVLILDRPAQFDASAIERELKRQTPKAAGQLEVAQSPNDKGLLVTFGSGVFIVMLVNATVPRGAFDVALHEDNRLWPQAAAAVDKHRAHIVVTGPILDGPVADRVAMARDMTALCAALAACTPCLGVCWGTSQSIIDTASFLRAAAGKPNTFVETTVWVRLHFFGSELQQGPARVGCVTAGLSAFVGREIEFEPAALPLGVVAERVLGTVEYLLAAGPIFNHGDTLGVTDTERIRITHHEKGALVAGPIYRLDHEVAA